MMLIRIPCCGGGSAGKSEIIASIVIGSPAIEAAFCDFQLFRDLAPVAPVLSLSNVFHNSRLRFRLSNFFFRLRLNLALSPFLFDMYSPSRARLRLG
jgi:hypothetical protein